MNSPRKPQNVGLWLWDYWRLDRRSKRRVRRTRALAGDRTYWHAELRADKPRYLSPAWWWAILSPRDGNRRQVPFTEANLICSRTTTGLHLPVIDLDRGFATVESSTPGHGHLYLETPMTWPRYVVLLFALWFCGVIELGFLLHSLRRGGTFVRLPHVKKEAPSDASRDDH